MRHLAWLAAFALTACAQMVWDKPGITEAQFNQDSARCRLLARGMNSVDFYAQGSAAFVAGATIGNAIGTAANAVATYKDCMIAAGYTQLGPQAAALSAKIKPILERGTACMKAAYFSPEATPIRARTPFLIPEMTAAELADASFATEQDIAAYREVLPREKECQRRNINELRAVAPNMAAIFETAIAATDADRSALVAHRITWGQFNTQRHDRVLQVQAELREDLETPSP